MNACLAKIIIVQSWQDIHAFKNRPQGFASVVESLTHDVSKEFFILGLSRFKLKWCQAKYRRGNFWWRVECTIWHGQKIISGAMILHDDRQTSIGFGVWFGSDAVNHFFLEHKMHVGDDLAK